MKKYLILSSLIIGAMCGVHAAEDVVLKVCGEGANGEGNFAIHFAPATEGFGICGIVPDDLGMDDGGFAAGGKMFWEIVLAGPNGLQDEITLSNQSAARARTCERDSEGITFHWRGLDVKDEKGVLNVTARVRIVSGKGRWTLSVDNRSKHYALLKTRYPYLQKIVEKGKGDILRPGKYAGAFLMKNYVPTPAPLSFGYPSYYPMLGAWFKNGRGLYFGAEDGECRQKMIFFTPDNGVYLETTVEDASIVGKAAEGPRFETVITCFKGDWWKAAWIYRDWALKQHWAAKGRLIDRTDYARTLANSHLHLWLHRDAGRVTNLVALVQKQCPGLRFSLEWNFWNLMPWDTDYPEIFPPQKGFAEGQKVLREKGIYAANYTNGRLWQKDMAGFRYAQGDACHERDGTIVQEHYCGRDFAVMCPYTKGWQETIATNELRLLNEQGVVGVYIDQVACSKARPCFAANHGHPLGGGSHWAEGYRRMLEPIHAAYSAKNQGILTEGTGDTWLDLLDGYYLDCTPTGNEVPFFPAVYSGRAIYYNSHIDSNLSNPAPEAWFAACARALVWGVEPGGIGAEFLINKNYTQVCSNIYHVCMVRQAASEYFVFGSLKDEVRFEEALEEAAFSHGPTNALKHFALPAVLGTLWRDAADKRTASALVNISAKPQTIRFKLPKDTLRAIPRALPFQEVPTCAVKDGICRVTLKPHQIALVECYGTNESKAFNLATFNVRCPATVDTNELHWAARMPRIAHVIRAHQFDIFGVQESTEIERRILDADLPDFAHVGCGRDKDRGGEAMCIYYRTSRFTCLEEGTFWLSEHPDEPGTKYTGAGCPRTCTWALLEDRVTGKRFRYFNTHLDHISPQARRDGIKVLFERGVKEAKARGETIFLTGDLNEELNAADPTNPIAYLGTELTDTLDLTDTPHRGPLQTFHGWKGVPRVRIDYIFTTPNVFVRRHVTYTDKPDGNFASDHYPVMATIEIR